MKKNRVLFIYNPTSGQGKIRTCLSDVVDILIKADFEVEIYATQEKQDAVSVAEKRGQEFDRIICSGGDGTLDEVVTGLMRAKADVPVGYLPSGSANDFGNSLGIGTDIISAANTAAGSEIFNCDIGRFNGDYFVYVAAFGLFTEASYTTSQDLKNMIGYLAYVFEGAKQLMDIPSYRIEGECDDESFSGDFLLGMITNSTYIGGVKGLISEENISLNDGVFEITLVRTPKNPLEFAEVLGYFANINRDTKLIFSRQAKKISMEFSENVSWTLDGEYGGEHKKTELECMPQALKIFV